RSLGEAQSIDPGFDLRRGATATIALGFGGRTSEAEGRVFFDQLLERARSLPGVTSAALAGHLPLGMTIQSRSVEFEGRPLPEGEDELEVEFDVISPGYLRTLGVNLPFGRDFTEQDRAESPGVVLVNEEAARRFWPGENPLGKRVRFSEEGPWLEVVGVTETGKYRTLGEDPRPFVYRPFLQEYSALMTLVVRGEVEEAQLVEQVRREIEALDPTAPIFDLRSVSQHLGIMLFPARMGAVLLAAFGLLGLVLASVGLYGVVAYVVSRRTREVGVRLALGARRQDVLSMVVWEGMTLVAEGVVAGVGAALALGRLVANWLYGIESYDPLTFVAVPVLLALVALAANLVPARRATRIDPMVALRYE
ncbi:MAG: ABC transporter permease, partial [Acidobacteria bacterium]|nr:ABC transporter permease [Acidobacteriota bacterium]